MTEKPRLTHIGKEGKAKMVDIGEKHESRREAVAEAYVSMSQETLELITDGLLPKGDVFSISRIAGVMAAKKTPELIPLCHPIRIDSIDVDFEVNHEENKVRIVSRVSATEKTGVEMEALTSVAVAGLAFYDMCKSVERQVEIRNIRLIEKRGGKSGVFIRR
ncbi:MAG: cyclic pyranopterin monophosphate synthase MoaC [Actinomycetota bacterium]|nr:cyclic pyranopterin monophosphate synthase MoaC [Actinomycetota bacterium]